MNLTDKFFAELRHWANADIEAAADARAIGGALGMAPSAAQVAIRQLEATGEVQETIERGMTRVRLTVEGVAACGAMGR